ncbi:MAG TPA: uracil-DNA glycosylase, partial [Gemmatimonadaceae bacterium]|nr:uracil-DNA glycosylase [Gemmatimonadaceae bacterium]
MDAREQLRRYLEQRREMGETELVLDTLGVDEALRLLGAKGPASGSSAGPASRSATATPQPSASGSAGDTSDWRDALRATGAAPSDLAPKKPNAPDATVDRNASEPVSRPAPPAPSANAPMAPTINKRTEFPAAADQAIAATAASPLSDVPAGLSVGTMGGELFGGPMASLDSLEAIAAHVATCTSCVLHATAMKSVPGEGNPDADLMCVGEAPGATEDQTGRPFVGQAGQLLTKILAAIDLPREQVFICNVLKHRPPGNRNPLPE